MWRCELPLYCRRGLHGQPGVALCERQCAAGAGSSHLVGHAGHSQRQLFQQLWLVALLQLLAHQFGQRRAAESFAFAAQHTGHARQAQWVEAERQLFQLGTQHTTRTQHRHHGAH